MNLYAARGVAVREYPLKWGPADYLLFIDREAVGVIEAKRQGVTLTGVELQANKYSDGVPDGVPAPIKPLPFLYQSTGVESRFTNRLDPECRSRRIFHFHQPSTLADWVAAESVWLPSGHRLNNAPAGLRLRLQQLPELWTQGLSSLQLGKHDEAIAALRKAQSLSHSRTMVSAQLPHALGRGGDRAGALAILADLRHAAAEQYVSPYEFAWIHAGLDDRESALGFLEEACAEHSSQMIFLPEDPLFRDLRDDLRFRSLVDRVGAPGVFPRSRCLSRASAELPEPDFSDVEDALEVHAPGRTRARAER